jgi:hypothetical protein
MSELNISTDELILKRAAYWVSLLGMPESANEYSVTVEIPAENRFDVDCLKTLMEKTRRAVPL